MTSMSHATLSKDLWNRIEMFAIDGEGGGEFPFEDRLARENAWPTTYARRVVHEYKRFVFLAMSAGHPVTPSDQVDQAWHLHLTYTRSYWQRLCGEVLPRPLHHEPTKGGDAENDKFDDWYARTKQSYLRIFGEQPPADIWPDANVRFGDDLHYERVNTKHHFVIPKRVAGRLVKFGVLAGGVLMLVAGCTPMVLGQSDAWSVVVLIALLLLIVFLLYIARKCPSGPGGGCGGSGCAAGCGSGCGGGGCGGGGCGGGGD